MQQTTYKRVRGGAMNVKNFMNTHVVTASPSATLPQIWNLINTKHLHSLPIVDKKRKLKGIIAKEDFLAKLYPDLAEGSQLPMDSDEDIHEKMEKLKKLKAADIMNTAIIFTRPDTNVMRALSRMIVRNVRQLPVLDENDTTVGMISKADIFAGLFKQTSKSTVASNKIKT